MMIIFFPKCSKYYVDSENAIKFEKNVVSFGDNCLWTCCEILCQLRQEYMGSPVNVLKSGPKISNPTNRHDTELSLFDINGTFT